MAHYLALVLFCRRWFIPSSPMEEFHQLAVASVTDTLYSQCNQEKRRIIRYIWPMFVAAIETQDPIHRTWLLERLYEIRGASAECQWNWRVAKQIISLQSATQDHVVDLLQFMTTSGNGSSLLVGLELGS